MPKSCFLNRDFKKVFREGKSWRNGVLTLLVYRKPHGSQPDSARIGIIIPGKIAGAVQRNKLRRRMKEIFRVNKHKLEPFADIVFIVTGKVAVISFSELRSRIVKLWTRAGIFREGSL